MSGGAAPSQYVLYAMPGSLYSAKARAYLRKHRFDYLERAPGEGHFDREVIPRTGRWIIPVLQTPHGTLIQDTVDIIDHLDPQLPPGRSAYPQGASQRVVAHMLELFGGEGLLRPAMHYRWNFDESNLAFLFEDFTDALVPGGDHEARSAVFEYASARMRKATTGFGVTPELFGEVERSYEEFLSLLTAHLETAPYLLGGRPTIADFGFIGPLFAHLARDPHPSLLMKQRAHRVWRWVERMNAPVLDASEYGERSEELFAADAIPATLRALLAYIGEEFCAETVAIVRAIDQWLAENPATDAGETIGGRPERRMIGRTSFDWRGHTLTISVVPYRLYVLQRLQQAFARATASEQDGVRAIFAEAGLEPILAVRARRRVERRANLDVWGEAQDPRLGE